MSHPNVVQRIVPLEHDLFVGMDVDKKSIAVTILDHGDLCRSLKMSNNADALLNYIRKRFSDKRIAFTYEAGPTGYALHDRLVEAGHPCLVAPSSMVPVQRGPRVKTNRLDSKHLAGKLRGGELAGIRVPSGKYRELRHLAQLRNVFVRQSTATKCRIKALLLFENIPFPDAPKGSQWSEKVLDQLKELRCSTSVRFKLAQLIETLRFSRHQAADAQKEIRRLCEDDSEFRKSIECLMSIPGIGWIVASNLLARIGDWRLLRNVQELAGFLGLAPCEHSTGDDVNKGNITRSGDKRLRNMLIEASWSAIRQDGELADFYTRVKQRHPRDRGPRKAIVAVARKLTTRIYRVLKDQRPYEMRNGAQAATKAADEKARQSAPGEDSTLRRVREYKLKPTVGFPCNRGLDLETESSRADLRPSSGGYQASVTV